MNYGDYKVKPKIRNSVSTERKFPSGKIYLKDGTEVITKIQKWKFPSGKIFFSKNAVPTLLNMDFRGLKYGNSINFNYFIITFQKKILLIFEA
jgi:hypothetical protein